ncbi:MAG: hypothetical protein AAFU85_24420 [Planctomycetota bacterium]
MSRSFQCPDCAQSLSTAKAYYWHLVKVHGYSSKDAYEIVGHDLANLEYVHRRAGRTIVLTEKERAAVDYTRGIKRRRYGG